ncbi:MAG: DUF3142 domain-containing protein [Candidatus Hydrogenedens sp.]|nr:DUF3142 domain-containing protein [Candidatus Hydrogenedens sp.]
MNPRDSAAASLFLFFALCATSGAADQWAYIWQQVWTPAVSDAVRESRPLVDGFMVLAADVSFDQEPAAVQIPSTDWQLLSSMDVPVIAVVRLGSEFIHHVQADADKALAWLDGVGAEACAPARASGAVLQGLQFDFDCPTEHLDAYAKLLSAFRKSHPDTNLSITTLPDWLGRRDFDALLRSVDSYVLQAHGLERPRHVSDPMVLCDPEEALQWIHRASRHQVPFQVALPTYGYRMFFHADGAFAGLSAEGAPAKRIGAIDRELRSDPVVISALAAALRKEPPGYLKGITWFRLPVDDDTLNWNLPTWKRVLQGEPVAHQLAVQLEWPQPRLIEIYLNNGGETRPGGNCRFEVHADWSAVAAYDTHNGFHMVPRADGTAAIFEGSSPLPGERKLAAWLRFTHDVDTDAIYTGEVDYLP